MTPRSPAARSLATSTPALVAVCVLALATVPAPAAAQYIGLKGGFNLTDFVGDDAGDDESKVGLNAGGSFQILNIGPVSIGPEVYYAQKGSKPEMVGGPGVAVPSQFNLAYVEVPVLLTVRLPRFADDRLQPFLHGGPAFAWNLDCDLDFTDPDAAPEETCESLLGGDLESTIEDYDQGVTLGGGMNVIVIPGRGALNLDLRYTGGLSDVVERESGEDLEIKNRAFTAMLGYSFSL